jgi:LysR family transcriptional regulator, glycine cleavage system transcriptional activator
MHCSWPCLGACMLKRGEIPSIGGLLSFVAAAEHGSFTRAARELNLTQGAISRQIREVESRLGIRLFERIRQRVVLTEAGRQYLTQVKKALNDLADAIQKAVSFSNSTTLNLVVLPTFGARWLVPRLSEFQNKHPDITIHLTTRQEPVNFDFEPFDVAVFHDAGNWPGTIARPLMTVDMLGVCSPKLNAKREIRTPADIAKFPLLHQAALYRLWPKCLTDAGVILNSPLPGHTYQDFSMLAQAAVAGLGIALLPDYLVEAELAGKQLEIVASEFLHIETSFYLIVPESRTSCPAVETFTDWLIAEADKWASSIRRSRAPKAGKLSRKVSPDHAEEAAV